MPLPEMAKPISFEAIWKNYPSDDPCVNPRTGKKAYDDQCAIRVGIALEKSGVSFKTFPGPRCEFGPSGNGMVLRATELANWLMRRPFAGCPDAETHQGKSFDKSLSGRTGIIYFEDYWLRTAEAKFPTGDRIDLWDRNRLTPSWTTFLRFSLGIDTFRSPWSGNGYLYSDLHASRRVVFWPIS
jgi:hypothetical protein